MLLTLDLATRICGWTCGEPAAISFTFGEKTFPPTGEDLGLFLVNYDQWLRSGIIARKVTEVCYEAPIMMGKGKTQLIILRKLYGIGSHTEFVCSQLGIECTEANVTSVKKFTTNNGRADKPEMLAAIRQLGYDAKGFDEADAIAVRLFALHHKYPALVAKMKLDLGPLGAVARMS
jgi:hypothetical protein